MSGIAGIFFRDGRPAEPEALERMGSALAHRGPDGKGVWIEGAAGIGHLMLHVTPESLHEKLPLVKGDLVITADARIDNREELLTTLRLSEQPRLADSELILAAYERWGRACPESLVGDFAFAIWDKREQRLFCARDHFGVKPFYYYRSDRLFAFASEIKGLLQLPEVPRDWNEAKIASYLTDLYMMYVDNETTFYKAINRLPPAHFFEIDSAAARLERYWTLDPTRAIQMSSDEEYAGAFREIFTEAVRCRLRSAFPIGSHLSGGLDSSSVVGVARSLLPDDQPLHTFHSLPQAPECDESAYANAVVAQGKLAHHIVPACGLFTYFDEILRYQDEPPWTHSNAMYWNICLAAQPYGVRVMLDGDDGDSAVSHGFGYFGELAYTGQWGAFIAEVTDMAERREYPRDSYLFQCYPYLTDLFRRGRWGEAARAINQLAAAFPGTRTRLVRNSLRPLIPERLLRLRRTLPGDLPQKQLVAPALRRFDQQPTEPLMRTEREDHAFLLLRGAHQSIVEETGRLAAPFSMEERHPFRDKRLIEFCLALPPQQKLFQGWNRIVMRRGMEAILPSEVQWRGDKINGLPHQAYSIFHTDRALLDAVIQGGLADVKQYIDIAYLGELYSQVGAARTYTELCAPGKNRLLNSIQKAFAFTLWFRSRGAAQA
jgi:asparagine synthase (glutamine-hydrolysing)